MEGIMKKTYKWFYLGGVVILLALLAVLVSYIIAYDRIDSWLERAKDAGKPAQVAEFLTAYKESLAEKDLIEGKYYSLWRYPATKMSIYIRVIDGLIERAESLSSQSPNDESYQMGLINLEKDLGDIDARAFSVWFSYGGWVVVLLVSILFFWVVMGWVPLIW